MAQNKWEKFTLLNSFIFSVIMPLVDPCTLLTYHNYNFCLRVVSHESDATILLAFSSPTHAQSHTLLLPNE